MTPMLLFRHFFAVITILMQHFVSLYEANDDQSCGVSTMLQPRIISGTLSNPDQWPWLAALYMRESTPTSTTYQCNCGGSIISTLHILTAAHCMKAKPAMNAGLVTSKGVRVIPAEDMLIKLGENNVDLFADPARSVFLYVSAVFMHDGFNVRNFVNDITILKLTNHIQFNHAIQPICLPTMDMVNFQFENSNAVLAGWGNLQYGVPYQKPKLHHVQLSVLSNDYCRRAVPLFTVLKSTICTHNPGLKGSCNGDSGGPLMKFHNNRWYAIGLTSTVQKSTCIGTYARVSEFIPWIHQIMSL